MLPAIVITAHNAPVPRLHSRRPADGAYRGSRRFVPPRPLQRLRAEPSQRGGQSPPPPQLLQTPPSSRLFSNVGAVSAEPGAELKRQPGNAYQAAALVAGTAVGAGVLALPAETAASGFLASSVAILGGWAFSVATGMLLAEASLWALRTTGSGGISLATVAGRTLGPVGAAACGAVYLFLSYALLVAYISRGGDVIASELHVPPSPQAAHGTAVPAVMAHRTLRMSPSSELTTNGITFW